MHIRELTEDQAKSLGQSGLGPIEARVKLHAKTRVATKIGEDGEAVFANTYQNHTIDVTDSVLNSAIVVKSSIPALPTGDGTSNQQGAITVQVANKRKWMGAVQRGSILDPDAIQDAEFEVLAECGSMTPLPIYRGRVAKYPVERFGVTEFDVRSAIWGIIDVPVRLEMDASRTIDPLYALQGGQIAISGVDTIAAETGLERMTFFHGITTFDEYGQVISTVVNESDGQVAVNRVDFRFDGESPLLGKYTIEFVNESGYKITQPDRRTFYGSVDEDFEGGFIKIAAGSWSVAADPTGAKIEFFCSYNARGNPITIVKNLLSHAFKSTWGDHFSQDPELNVDWSQINEFEQLYGNVIVHVSETNRDESAFDPASPNKPMRVRDLCQKILDHCGCQLTWNSQGKITVSSSWYLRVGQEIHKYGGEHTYIANKEASGHYLFSDSPVFDRLVLKYGYNPNSEKFGGRLVYVSGVKQKYQEKEIAFPYYKVGTSSASIELFGPKLWELVQLSAVRLHMELLPNYGLPVAPGDVFEADFSTMPVLPNQERGRFWMIYSVSKRIGGAVSVDAVQIPKPVTPRLLCFTLDPCDGETPPPSNPQEPVVSIYGLTESIATNDAEGVSDLTIDAELIATPAPISNEQVWEFLQDGDPADLMGSGIYVSDRSKSVQVTLAGTITCDLSFVNTSVAQISFHLETHVNDVVEDSATLLVLTSYGFSQDNYPIVINKSFPLDLEANDEVRFKLRIAYQGLTLNTNTSATWSASAFLGAMQATFE